MNNGRSRGEDDDDDRGLLWKIPEVKSRRLGRLGPGFGLGAGCGFGFGAGLLGGVGFGPGIPGLQLGFGLGVGCGVGVGFGYGVGRGVAHVKSRKYSNVGKLFQGPGNFSTQNVLREKNMAQIAWERHSPFFGYCPSESRDEIGALVDDIIINTKKLIEATSREVDKWRR